MGFTLLSVSSQSTNSGVFLSLVCSFLLVGIRKSTGMLLHTHPDLLSTRISTAGYVFTNTAELTSSNQKRGDLQSNARVMLTSSCQEDKDTYLAEQWHLIPCAERKVYLIFLQNVIGTKSFLQTVSRTDAISLNCLKKF